MRVAPAPAVAVVVVALGTSLAADEEYRQLQDVPRQFYSSLCFSPDGALIAAAGQQEDDRGRPRLGHVTIWSVHTGKVVFREGDVPFWMSDVHFSPNGELLAVSCFDRSVWVYRRVFDRRRRMHWQKIKRLPQVAARPLPRHPQPWTDRVHFSPDGGLLAASNQGFRAEVDRDPARCIQLWRVEDFSEVGVLRGPERPVSCLRFFPDGRQLVAGYVQGSETAPELPIWDVESQTVVRELRLEGVATKVGRGVHQPAVDISSDGKLLAVGAYAYLALIDAESPEVRRRLVGHEKEVRSVSFSPTQPLLASGGEDRTMRLWNIETGEQLAIRELSEQVLREVLSVQFSPDGKLLATIADWETPQIWDVSRLVEEPDQAKAPPEG